MSSNNLRCQSAECATPPMYAMWVSANDVAEISRSDDAGVATRHVVTQWLLQ